MAVIKLGSSTYVRMFLMVDSTDHVTGKTGLTVTVTRSIAGAAFGATANSPTEVGSGWYKITLGSADTGTAGDLAFHATATGADPTDWVDQVFNRTLDDLAFPATSGRSMVVDASGLVDANAVKIGPSGTGTAQTARDIGASVLLSTGTGTGQLDFTSGIVKANATQILGTAVSTPATAGILDVNLKNIANAAVSTSSAQLGVNVVNAGAVAWASGAITASVIADAAIDRATFAADTGLAPVAVGTLAAVSAGSATLDAGAVGTTDYYKDCFLLITGGVGVGQIRLITTNTSGKVCTLVPNTWATTPNTSSTYAVLPFTHINQIEAYTGNTVQTGDAFARLGAPNGGVSISADIQTRATPAQVATALTDIDLDHLIHVATGIPAPVDGTFIDNIMNKDGTQTFDPTTDSLQAMRDAQVTAASLVTSIWSEPVPGAYAAGSAGKVLATAGAAADPWSANTSSYSTAGTYGKVVKDALTGMIPQTGDAYLRLGTPAGASIEADIAAVKTDTANIYSRIGAPAGASIEADIAAIKAVLPTALGANGNIKADLRDTNGIAVTSAAGRPEVNTTHAAGTAWASGAITSSVLATDALTSTGLASSAANEIADALLDRADAIETNFTVRNSVRIMLSALAGRCSGNESNAPVFRNGYADTKARITATTDANGNRTAVSLDAT